MRIVDKSRSFLPTLAIVLMPMLVVSHGAFADDEEPGIQLNERLWLHTTLETEWFKETKSLNNSPERFRERGDNVTIELELDARITESIDAHLGFTYDLEDEHGELDAYSVSWESDVASFSIGLQEIPFALTESWMISDPLTDFGTLDARSLVASAEAVDGVEITAAVYRGFAARVGSSLGSPDWALGATISPTDELELTLGYLSDLADSDERFLEDEGNRYEQRVPALSLLAVWSAERFQFSFEAVKALRSFDGLDDEINRPSAMSAEIGWAWREDVDLAIRLERSRKLDDAPRTRLGLGATWRFHPNASLAVEWLSGRYARDFAFDDDDNPLSENNFLGAQLKIRF